MFRGILAAVLVTAPLVVSCTGSPPTVQPTPSVALPSSAIVAASSSAQAAPAGASPQIPALQIVGTAFSGPGCKKMLSGFGYIWAISDSGLDKLSETKRSHVASDVIVDLGIGTKYVYSLVGGATNRLDEYDPQSGQVLRHWALSNGAHSLAVTDSAAYVIYGSHPATIDRIDLNSGTSNSFTVTELADGVIGAEALAAGGNLIWASSDGTTIYGLDPTTLAVKSTAHVPTSAKSLWFGDGSLWTSQDGYHGGVHRIDPATGSDAADIMDDAVQIAFSSNGAWLSASDGPTEIDPTTAQIMAIVPPDKVSSDYSGGIAVLNDRVFVSYVDTGLVQEIQVP